MEASSSLSHCPLTFGKLVPETVLVITDPLAYQDLAFMPKAVFIRLKPPGNVCSSTSGAIPKYFSNL